MAKYYVKREPRGMDVDSRYKEVSRGAEKSALSIQFLIAPILRANLSFSILKKPI